MVNYCGRPQLILTVLVGALATTLCNCVLVCIVDAQILTVYTKKKKTIIFKAIWARAVVASLFSVRPHVVELLYLCLSALFVRLSGIV